MEFSNAPALGQIAADAGKSAAWAVHFSCISADGAAVIHNLTRASDAHRSVRINVIVYTRPRKASHQENAD